MVRRLSSTGPVNGEHVPLSVSLADAGVHPKTPEKMGPVPLSVNRQQSEQGDVKNKTPEREFRLDRQYRLRSMTLTMMSLCCVCAPANGEPSIGQFELKTLESEPGSYEFQSQNAWSWGHPSRQIAMTGPDEFVVDENAVVRERYAIELEMGLTDFLKMRIGVEFEQERLDDPDSIAQANRFDGLKLDEFGAELIAILVPRMGDGPGFGLVAELEGPVNQEEPNSLVLGSIIEFQSGRWRAAAIPMVVHAFGGDAEDGERIDDKWDFAYAAQLMYGFAESWSLAFEGYGTVERLGNSGRRSESAQIFGDFNQHRAGAILYRTYELLGSRRSGPSALGSAFLSETGTEDEGVTLTVGFGLLEGLNANTPDHTLKLSIEVDF